MKTLVVNLRHSNAWTRYVGRPMYGNKDPRIAAGSALGNPFKGEREEAVRRFEAYFLDRLKKDEEFKAATLKLRGETLACWCAPQACHANVIASYLNALEEK